MYTGPNIPTNGLVLSLDAANTKSYVSGSTTWYDLAGNRNSGSLINSPNFDTANGGAITFDGVDDYCRFDQFGALQIPTFTITCFAKPISWIAGGAGTVIFTREFARLNLGLSYAGNIGAYFFIRGDNYPTAELNGVQAQYPFALGTWYHTTYIVDIPGKNYKMYVNGSEIWSSNINLGTDFQAPTASFPVIAARYSGTSVYSNIQIANFLFYNKVLSAAEVSQIYNSQKSRFGL